MSQLRHGIWISITLAALASGCGPDKYGFDASAQSNQAMSQANSNSTNGNPKNALDPENHGYAVDDQLPVNGTCKNNKVKLCHIPYGNPNNAHTICVAPNAAVNGHGVNADGSPGAHGGDYLGECGSINPSPTPVAPTPTPPMGDPNPTPTPPAPTPPMPTPTPPAPTPPMPTPTPPGNNL